MERRIAVRKLNQQTSAVLNEVARGQPITITSAGRPIARIVPIGPPRALDRLVAAGDGIAPAIRDPIVMPPDTASSSVDIAAALARDREQDRW
ncbi:MAG TPA: type II toxin-antitoxin system prevent-host-death family antitoxin [Chloroflexota bacterium]